MSEYQARLDVEGGWLIRQWHGSKPTRRPLQRRAAGSLTLAAIAASTLLALAGPATVAGTYNTTGSVNVRSGPGTNYAVVAGEPNGASFALICQWQNGTNVNGNASWDRVQFGNGIVGAISDYWTTTPTWNSYAPGTPDCNAAPPPPPPTPPSSQQKAFAWAQSEIGRTSDDYGRAIAGWCARWAVGAYGQANSGYTNAYNMYLAFRNMGLIHTGPAPAGTFVFFTAASVNKYAGHVAIADANGGMISTPAYSGQAIADRPLSYAGAAYLGWSYAPSGWTR